MKVALSRTLGLAAGLALVLLWASSASAQVVFTEQMSIGSRGAHVTALQSYLATKTTYYPEGLVTGYFGALTQAAVQRFQCAEEIVCSGTVATTGYGRAGPKTLLQLNLRAGGSVGADVSAPFIFGVSAATSSNSATISFATNESARGQVYYAPNGLTLTEAAGPGFTPIVGGTAVMTDAALKTSHAVTITGLASSTTYFYTVQAVDASGNLSVTWPAWFRTNP
ncbi:fibronectin type III domain-containing protein [Candidatus Kaiserbacteria bacterium]|nr:fibronectin type III domain-containing protein [Candidatus Kaiserbacteria bacterium]